jgi:DNA-binding GntR family transcriptional regulator
LYVQDGMPIFEAMEQGLRYKKLYDDLKRSIYEGRFKDGDLLPSEHELCDTYSVTRTTVRKALDDLVKERLITKEKGRGSVVSRSLKSLGILSVKGFSQAVSEQNKTVTTKFIEHPMIEKWPADFFYTLNESEQKAGCIRMKRLRCVDDNTVMLEHTFVPNMVLLGFCTEPFLNGSLFETLSLRYNIGVTGVEQDLRAILATKETAQLMQIEVGAPLLNIYFKFKTNRKELNIYSNLYCNTDKFSIGNII